MANNHESKTCSCSNPILGAEGYCNRCGNSISEEKIQILQSQLEENLINYDDAEVPVPPTNNYQPKSAKAPSQPNLSKSTSSVEAAKRTLKYSSLFENIGKTNQYLNSFAAFVMIVSVLLTNLTTTYKLLCIVVILISWWVSYLYTSLVRGLSSYFQMKASAHLEDRSK